MKSLLLVSLAAGAATLPFTSAPQEVAQLPDPSAIYANMFAKWPVTTSAPAPSVKAAPSQEDLRAQLAELRLRRIELENQQRMREAELELSALEQRAERQREVRQQMRAYQEEERRAARSLETVESQSNRRFEQLERQYEQQSEELERALMREVEGFERLLESTQAELEVAFEREVARLEDEEGSDKQIQELEREFNMNIRKLNEELQVEEARSRDRGAANLRAQHEAYMAEREQAEADAHAQQAELEALCAELESRREELESDAQFREERDEIALRMERGRHEFMTQLEVERLEMEVARLEEALERAENGKLGHMLWATDAAEGVECDDDVEEAAEVVEIEVDSDAVELGDMDDFETDTPENSVVSGDSEALWEAIHALQAQVETLRRDVDALMKSAESAGERFR